jgi:hypothetical protein
MPEKNQKSDRHNNNRVDLRVKVKKTGHSQFEQTDRSHSSENIQKKKTKAEAKAIRPDSEKFLFLWLGVGAVMILVVGFWFLNFRSSLSVLSSGPDQADSLFWQEWDKMASQTEARWVDLQTGLQELKEASDGEREANNQEATSTLGLFPQNQNIASGTPGDATSTFLRLKQALENQATTTQ